MIVYLHSDLNIKQLLRNTWVRLITHVFLGNLKHIYSKSIIPDMVNRIKSMNNKYSQPYIHERLTRISGIPIEINYPFIRNTQITKNVKAWTKLFMTDRI